MGDERELWFGEIIASLHVGRSGPLIQILNCLMEGKGFESGKFERVGVFTC